MNLTSCVYIYMEMLLCRLLYEGMGLVRVGAWEG